MTHEAMRAKHEKATRTAACAICKNQLRDCDGYIAITACNHHFCADCLFQWKGMGEDDAQGCPMCRACPIKVNFLVHYTSVIDMTSDDDNVSTIHEFQSVPAAEAARVIAAFEAELPAARAAARAEMLAEYEADDHEAAARLAMYQQQAAGYGWEGPALDEDMEPMDGMYGMEPADEADPMDEAEPAEPAEPAMVESPEQLARQLQILMGNLPPMQAVMVFQVAQASGVLAGIHAAVAMGAANVLHNPPFNG